MRIKYIRAKNFLSIGEPVEIDFTKFGNIINIIGENQDQGSGASNGSGKTTVISIIVYSLYGDLVKNLNHKQIINIKTGKNLEAEIHFDLDGHEYKIIRKREPDKLELWKDNVNESKGGIPATQEEINKTIKLNYTSFINIVCFGQHNTKQFLICKPSDKRIIAENLLSLEKYNKYCKNAKDKLKVIQEKLKYLSAIYDKSLQNISFNERQLKQLAKQQAEWKSDQLNFIERLNLQINKTKKEVEKLSDISSTDSFAKLQSINEEIEEKQKQRINTTEGLTLVSEKINKGKEGIQYNFLRIKEIQFDLIKKKKEIEEIKIYNHNLLSGEGGKCSVCYGIIDSSNFGDVLKYNESQIKDLSDEVFLLNDDLLVCQNKNKKSNDFLIKLQESYEIVKAKEILINKTLRELEQQKIVASASFNSNASAAELLLNQRIEHLREQIESKQNESDPYTIVLGNTKKELEISKVKCDEFKEEINNLERQVPYYEFWIKAFGDSGIRSFVIEEVIPILNDRINYWLQFLVDNKIKLTFDKELEEKIEREPFDGDPFVYSSMSGGEHQRIDLGIALAFAQVMMLTSGTCPSLIALDEVGTNLDRPGIQAVYNMICELSKERQVIVTTHDPDLQEMLVGYDTIKVIKKNGFTSIQK